MDVNDVVNKYECEDKVGRNLEKNKIDLQFDEYNQATAFEVLT
jgi:hypothetical protein